MRLIGLSLRDFFGYEALDLDLRDIRQLAVVGPNGSGKSTLCEAIRWTVGGRARVATDRMVRSGQTVAMASTTWDVRGDIIEMRRTRSRATKAGESSLLLTVNGDNLTRHTIAETEEAIRRITRIPVEALLAGPVMVQGRSAELMEADPGKRLDLALRVLGVDLDEYLRLHEEAK